MVCAQFCSTSLSRFGATIEKNPALSPDGKAHIAIIFIANRTLGQEPVYGNFTEASTRRDACPRAWSPVWHLRPCSHYTAP